MANYIDAEYKKTNKIPTSILVYEQDYETNELVTKEYKLDDYLYFYMETEEETSLASMTHKKVKKVFAQSYKDYKDGITANELRSMGLAVFESDIEPLQKCLFDNYGIDHEKQPNWNIALYDIEVDVNIDDGFPDATKAKTPITAVSVWYKKTNEVYEFTLVPPNLRKLWNYEHIEKRGDATILYFDNEKEMLVAWLEFSAELQTMAFGAWNGDFFDVQYIYNRLVKLFNKKTTAKLMGQSENINVTIANRDDDNGVRIIRPIGRIWFDSLLVYKSQAGEKDSYNLNAVAEDELGNAKIEFSGNFEDLYLSTRKNREIFKQLQKGTVGYKKSKKLIDSLIDDMELKPYCVEKLEQNDIPDEEYKTRLDICITEQLENIFKDTEIMEELDIDNKLFELGIVYRKMFDTYNLFLDYSIQDSVLLRDLENSTKYFNVLMMLAQYNVSFFHDTFSTLKQVENGIANFAHIHNKQVVIDREYKISDQHYNRFVDKDILDIRESRDYKINIEDSDKIKDIKRLLLQSKIPGAHVLLPQIGLISYSEEKTPPLARELKKLNDEYYKIIAELEELED